MATAPETNSGVRDLITGPISRTLLIFALPTLGSNILQSLNGSINAIWVGRFLGEGALAATSNANLVMFLMFSGVFGFGMATTIMIGQSMGRRDVDGVRRALGSAIGLFVLMSGLIATLGWIFAPGLLRLLATPDDAFPLALAYLRIIFLGMPPSFLMVLLTMGLRGTGDSMTPLWIMILTVILDCALNPVFILGLGPAPAMGIAGSAVATLIANAVSLAALIVYIYRRDLLIRLRGAEWRYLRPDPALIRVIFSKGFPMGLQMIVMSAAALVLIGLVNRQGVVTTAAYGVTSQIWTYIQMPALAVGAAVSAMAAQNIGAGRWDRVDRIARAGVILNLVITGAMVLLITLIDRQVLGLFLSSNSSAIPIAQHINIAASWSFILFGVALVLSAMMRANGIVIAPLVILFIASFPVRIGFAMLGLPHIGADAIWWSFPAGSIASVILTWAYYRRGTWREAKLIAPPSADECRESVSAETEPAGRMKPTG